METTFIELDAIEIELDVAVVKRHMAGHREGGMAPAIEARLGYLLQEVQQRAILQPRALIGLISADEMRRHDVFNCIDNALPDIRAMAMAVATIGKQFDQHGHALCDTRQILKATLLDAIGNAALSGVVAKTQACLTGWASRHQLQCSSRIQPGDAIMPLCGQKTIFEILPVHQIDVHLHREEVMLPRKTLCFATGLGRQMPTWEKAQVCRMCKQYDACRFKKSCNHSRPSTPPFS